MGSGRPAFQSRSPLPVPTGMTDHPCPGVSSRGLHRPATLVVTPYAGLLARYCMDYNNRPADDKIAEYLETTGRTARPSEIARETGLSKSYVTRRCKRMAEAEILRREEGGYVIGHDIPGMDSPVILNSDPDHLLNIVEEVAPSRLSEARGKPVNELRKFIKDELATATYPLGNRKVSYEAN